jgi:hypothetical protein
MNKKMYVFAAFFLMLLCAHTFASVPTLEAVYLNGARFDSGDIISPTGSFRVDAYCEAGITSAELYIDSAASPNILTQVAGSSNDGTWSGTYSLSQNSNVGSHIFRVVLKDATGVTASSEMGAVLFKGSVQMIGKALNFPNPFRPASRDPLSNTTHIQYVLSTNSNITLIIYDIVGHEVKRITLPSGSEGGKAGMNTVSWDGRSFMNNAVVGNGMYIYKVINSNKAIGSGKIVVLD